MSAATSRFAQWIALRGLIRKELKQVLGDPRMLMILLIVPVIQLIVFSYAATLDVATARAVMLDFDHSAASRSIAARVAASDSFELAGWVESNAQAEVAIARGTAEIAIIVPRGYGRALAGDHGSTVDVVVDGSDSSLAGVGINAATGLLQTIAGEVAVRRVARLGVDAPPFQPTVEVRSRVWYNPELKSRIFMIPGVLGTVLVIVTMIATSMALVREKELGTLEQLLVTPVSRATMLAGKLLPFALIGFVDTAVIMLVAVFWFHVPMLGSPVVLFLNVIPFLCATLGLGLLVSAISSTQQQAMMTSIFFVMLPMMYLSGFIFPVESMPDWVQPIADLMPLRYFLVIVRGVMLKGATAADLMPSIVKLSGLSLAIFFGAILSFRKRSD